MTAVGEKYVVLQCTVYGIRTRTFLSWCLGKGKLIPFPRASTLPQPSDMLHTNECNSSLKADAE